MKAFYKCHLCEIENVFVEVRERYPNEDIKAYVEYIASVCGEEHGRRTPWCPKRHLDIALPMTQNGIGFAGPELTEQDKKELAEKYGLKKS